MDYERIYAAFIADRRIIESALPILDSYTEKHHVVPRAKGGTDFPENLIRLTPEDHFFAHLLLAKIHGGELWAPIAFMAGGSRKDYRPTYSRKRHGWAVRSMAAAKSGAGAHQFDRKVYTIVNAAGESLELMQSEMPGKAGLSKSLANMLIKDRVRVAKGWSIKGRPRDIRIGAKHHSHRPEIREFRHVDGDAFTGTQYEFSEAKKLRRPDVSRLVNGVYQATQGWYLAGRGLPESPHAKAKWRKHLEN